MIRRCFVCQSEGICSHREEGLLRWYRRQCREQQPTWKPVRMLTFGQPRKAAGIAKPGAVHIARSG